MIQDITTNDKNWDVEKKVKEIISENLDVDVTTITSNADLMNDLGADSLDAVEIIMALEEELDIQIPDEEAEKLKTVHDIVTFIQSKIN